MIRFGRGLVRDIPAAAHLHVHAAMQGDVVSMGNLGDYEEEIEAAALAGDAQAALCMAKIFGYGLSGMKDKVKMLAWIERCEANVAGREGEYIDELNALKSTCAE